MVAHVTSSWNSGYQNGDIKGAFLSDTDDTDLVGSGELVTNGTFDTDVSGWVAKNGLQSDATDNVFTWDASGAMLITRGSGGIDQRPAQNISTLVGKTYVVSLSAVDHVVTIRVANSTGGTRSQQSVQPNSTVTFIFIASSTISTIEMWATLKNSDPLVDNISVKLADADRSVNNNGLIVNGTITRTFVDEV